MKVINLFAGPGAGKSTTAAGIFWNLKMAGLNVELVTEYAKDMTWERRENVMADQIYMFAKQHRRLHRLRDHAIDVVVTDSPLLLSSIYAPHNYPESFNAIVLDFFKKFYNYNFFIERVKPYNPVGRWQTAEEAKDIDREVRELLVNTNQPFLSVLGDENAPQKIIDLV